MLIAFTGKRGVGKSEAAKILGRHGFLRCHVFAGGKAASAAYFVHIGATPEEARRMVDGDLKDIPSDYLPGRQTPRYFMEQLGRFMGSGLGAEWTLGSELAKLRKVHPGADVVIESLAYEQDIVRLHGGVIVRIVRPGIAGPVGINTDSAQAEIRCDAEVANDGSVEALEEKLMAVVDRYRPAA